MTVKDLIQLLQQFPGDTPVVVPGDGEFEEVGAASFNSYDPATGKVSISKATLDSLDPDHNNMGFDENDVLPKDAVVLWGV